ncbi:MAG TPA: PIN domain-containing protein [Anaerolineales bacterium]|nr:PIN domain-containing protein [Anaerolineales bacterium]
MIFVDTSAILSVLVTNDVHHERAVQRWHNLLEENQIMLTNNYVLVESTVIIQKRLGLTKVRDFQENILPFLTTEWLDETQHNIALQHVLAANRRQLSLVDCSCFETMRRLNIEKVFTFDSHFREQGFEIIP